MGPVNRALLVQMLFACVLLTASHPVHAHQPATFPSPPADAASTVLYPESPSGLEHLGKDLVNAVRNNDSPRAMTLAQSMVLPDTAAWYHQTYGDFSGKQEILAYEHDRHQLPASLLGLVKKAIAAGATGIHVKRFGSGCDDNDGENTFPVLEPRLHATPLYDLRLFSGDKYFRIWPIAYVDGTFRYVGEPQPWRYFAARESVTDSPSPPKSPAQEKEDREVAQIMQGGAAVAARLVSRTNPVYPDVARGEHVQGVVTMHAVIGRDGQVENLHVIKGYCSLSMAAMEAVRKWRYSPTTLSGNPVAVDTSIDVVFRLNQR